jgi:hypothetical protein
MIRKLIVTAALALAAVFAFAVATPRTALAADKCGDDTTRKGKIKTEKRGNVVVIVEALVICGKVPKPLALVFMSGSTINYEWENNKPDFLKRVHESLSQSPF